MTTIPSIEAEEYAFLKELTRDLDEKKLMLFISIYNGKRKKAEVILICTLLGFVLAAGIHRFVVGQIGMGILYLFTAGLCFIGTIMDLINHKEIANEYNRKVATETLTLVNMHGR